MLITRKSSPESPVFSNYVLPTRWPIDLSRLEGDAIEILASIPNLNARYGRHHALVLRTALANFGFTFTRLKKSSFPSLITLVSELRNRAHENQPTLIFVRDWDPSPGRWQLAI